MATVAGTSRPHFGFRSRPELRGLAGTFQGLQKNRLKEKAATPQKECDRFSHESELAFKEEQIIETQDKPQCLVAAKATLTLTIPGCN